MRPTTGDSLKPCPLNPTAQYSPPMLDDLSRIGLPSGVMSYSDPYPPLCVAALKSGNRIFALSQNLVIVSWSAFSPNPSGFTTSFRSSHASPPTSVPYPESTRKYAPVV